MDFAAKVFFLVGRQRVEMTEDFAVQEKLLGTCGIESSRFEIEKRISLESVNLA